MKLAHSGRSREETAAAHPALPAGPPASLPRSPPRVMKWSQFAKRRFPWPCRAPPRKAGAKGGGGVAAWDGSVRTAHAFRGPDG